MNREEVDQLLRQAESNEVWAVVSKPKKAKQLRKVAKQMTTEAIAILDDLGEGFKPDARIEALSDDELLSELGL